MANEILECPIDEFLDHYSPFKPSNQFVDNARRCLKNNLPVNEVENGGNTTWSLADFKTPFEKKDSESTIFERLVNIMRVLEKVKDADGRKHSFSYKDCPTKNMASEIDGTDFRVDACITSSPKVKPLILSDAAVVAEFKKADNPKDVEDNRIKLISAAVQIMNDDPRRMWVYGITIEYTQMAVWYFCRSHSVKSASFDFTTDVNTFIRVFLSFLYATDPEIGYDPTVTRVKHEGKICYVYEVGTEEAPRYYRTTELIFAARVLCTTGRKTRVWKVVEVEGHGEGQFGVQKPDTAPVVLKDGWLDEGSRPEKETQSRIFESLANIQSSDYGWASGYLHDRLSNAFQDRKYQEYFMEIIDSRLLAKTKLCHESAKPNPEILSVARLKSLDSFHLRAGMMQSGSHSGMPVDTPSHTSGKKDLLPREYKAKQQHRLIYNYVGCDLYHAKDLATSFYVIHDTFIALVLLFLAGWTHRDISTGNIIIVEKGGRAHGKLSDLEYAKKFSDEATSTDPKTGTPYFMPLEIHRARPIVPQQEFSLLNPVNIDLAPIFQSSPSTNGRKGRGAHAVKFRFQHDVESLWWVALWILLCRVGGEEALVLAESIFTNSNVPSHAREFFFIEGYDGLGDCIHKDLASSATAILSIRAILYNSYASKEKTEDLMNPAQYTDVYMKVWGPLTVLVRDALHAKGIAFQSETDF